MYSMLAITFVLAAPVPTEDAATLHAKVIAPYLDAQTYAVVRIDLTKPDADALATALGDFGVIDSADVKDLETEAFSWLAAFAKAGGKELYYVFTTADGPQRYFAVVPVADGADVRALGTLLTDTLAPPGPREKVGGALIAGDKAILERLSKMKPVERPELAKAFAAAREGIVQAAVIPTPQTLRAVADGLPDLPREFGGTSTKPLTHGIEWAALGLDLSPKLAMRLIIKSPDGRAALTLADALSKVIRALGGEQVKRVPWPGLDKIANQLAPAVAADKIELKLEDNETRTALAPVLRRGLELVVQVQCTNNLKMLTLAAQNYENNNGALPAVAIVDKAGKPLLSWRVHLLPYLEEAKLYQEFHLDEPWDSEHNKKLIARMPAVFRGPSPWLNAAGKTIFLAPTGKGTAWPGGPKGLRIFDFNDGTSQTIYLVTADNSHAVEWTKPEDLKFDPAKPHAGLGRHSGLYLFGMADGSVHPAKLTVSKETLKDAFGPNDCNVLGKDWD
jgi:Protein of unknown function (DUF1559)